MKQGGYFTRRTRIVCTLGPATCSPVVLEQLIKAGMNVARLNLSHGTYKEHTQSIRMVRKLALATPIAVLLDLPGPRYRTGKLKSGEVMLNKGAQVILTTRPIRGDDGLITVHPPSLIQDIKVDDVVLLDDGAIELRVLRRQGTDVGCRVMVGGMLSEERGLVVPGMRISGSFVSDTLLKCILFAIRQRADYLALSFVSSAEDVTSVREILREQGADIAIVSKIETGSAVDKFDSILAVSDGIMVARGDLGVDIPLRRIPMVQKEIVEKCNEAGKPVIIATQMLESMVNAPRPTRAEVTDVANAVFDGADAIMLSEETSIGKYPVQALKMMASIAREVERKLPYEQMLAEHGKWLEQKTDELISYSACHTAQSLKVAALVAFTQSGSTAGRVSKYRPRMPILAITPDAAVVRRLTLRWGVYPFQIAGASSVAELFSIAAKLSRQLGLAKAGDLIVITGGIPVGVAGSTNLLKVEKVE
jgi:pyruvate kinase